MLPATNILTFVSLIQLLTSFLLSESSEIMNNKESYVRPNWIDLSFVFWP